MEGVTDLEEREWGEEIATCGTEGLEQAESEEFIATLSGIEGTD